MDHRKTLRKLSIRDDDFVCLLLAHERENVAASSLDAKTHALVRIASLVAVDADPVSYVWATEAAFRQGATPEEIVGILIAVMPAVGTARVVSAAPKLGIALGYDVADALEEPPPLRTAFGS